MTQTSAVCKKTIVKLTEQTSKCCQRYRTADTHTQTQLGYLRYTGIFEEFFSVGKWKFYRINLILVLNF